MFVFTTTTVVNEIVDVLALQGLAPVMSLANRENVGLAGRRSRRRTAWRSGGTNICLITLMGAQANPLSVVPW
jgi:hypothetical protein